MGEEQREDIEDETEEAVECNPCTRPDMPTADEYSRRRLTHLPYRSWCKICVQAKGRNLQHKKKHTTTDKHRQMPTIAVDYMFTGGKDKEGREGGTSIVRD